MPALKTEALYFGPVETARFGQLHQPAGGPSRAVGVVLCGPIGDDEIRAHRPLRHLADRLAGEGFACLRFDWLGTGDSLGDARSPELVAAWLADVGLAADALRAHTGVKEVLLIGLRLGATLALAAAPRLTNVAAVAAWGAYGSGGEFVAERVGLHRMRKTLDPESFAAGPPEGSREGKEALGFLLTPGTIAGLEKLVAVGSEPPAPSVLIIGTGNLPTEPLAARLTKLGCDVESQHLPGQKFLLVPPHRAALPTPILDAIVGWCVSKVPVGNVVTPAAATPRQDREEVLRFGPEGRLFGVYTPAHAPAAAALAAHARETAFVLLNAGSVHRVGPHRLSVAMARRWAQAGNAVLRFDQAGIGDSPAVTGREENLQYPDTAVSDTQAALTALATASGARRFVLVGSGSGADIAFATARVDERVIGLALLNPYTFCVNSEALIESYRHARRYGRSILNPQSWRRVLSGEISVRHTLANVLPKATDVVKRRLQRFLTSSPRPSDVDDVPTGLERLAARGVETLLLSAKDDPGVSFLDDQSDALSRLEEDPRFRRERLTGVDQTFTSAYAQGLASDLVTAHLQRVLTARALT